MVKINTFKASLRSKCFPAVSEQRKTEKLDSRFWPREMKREPKNERGDHCSRGLCCTIFDSRNSTETLPTQANLKQKLPHPPFRFS